MTAGEWAASIHAVTLVVTDLEASREFYLSAFGAQVVHEDADSVVFGFGSTLVNLLARSAADELLAPSPVGDSTDAPRIVFTVPVPDVDEFCMRLAEAGVTLINGPMTRPWGPRTASFADPSGHVWEIAS